MPRVDVTFTPDGLGKEQITGAVVVAIDVLRATTTAVTTLANGARAVLPVAEPDDGRRALAAFPPGEALLGGERYGRPLPGFALGNSPSEYRASAVAGRTVILTTTNGTQLLARCGEAAEVLLAGLVNAGAVAGWLAGWEGDILLACAGRHGGFSLEDTACAGLILSRLGRRWQWGTGAAVAGGLWGAYATAPDRLLQECPHGKYLVEIGLGADLADCGAVDRYALVPRRRDGAFQA